MQEADLPTPLLSCSSDSSLAFYASHVVLCYCIVALAANLPDLSAAWRFLNALQLVNRNGVEQRGRTAGGVASVVLLHAQMLERIGFANLTPRTGSSPSARTSPATMCDVGATETAFKDAVPWAPGGLIIDAEHN
jgi:hypothetical protein